MKENLSVSFRHTAKFLATDDIKALAQQSLKHIDRLNAGTGPGNDFLGWLTLPDDIMEQLERIQETAAHLQSVSNTTVVIGIGGSYLGARAVIEGLTNAFSAYRKDKFHDVIFAGQNLCEDYMDDLLELLNERNYSIIVISKSGVTTEPAIAFRIIRDHLEKKVGTEEAAKRIVAITDAKKGALRPLAEKHGYKTFVIPDDIGGRYSVLTPVGLLPIAVSGIDIRELVKGAKSMIALTRDNHNPESNPALLYASARNLLLRGGRPIETQVNFTPRLHYFAEWWKQLFGESEGKEGKGIFPASVDLTTDLHSMGQYIQEGQRILFETFISVGKPDNTITITRENDDSDQLNYLAGQRLSDVNHNAEAGTMLAHYDGDVPIITVNIPKLDAYYIGQLIYFYEMACAISGYILGVNPFNQPGVEAYKRNMFALLNKPGFEKDGQKLRERLK